MSALFKEGDVLSMGLPFPGMTDESFDWEVSSVSSEGVTTFDVLWHGVAFCQYARKIEGGKTIWHRVDYI